MYWFKRIYLGRKLKYLIKKTIFIRLANISKRRKRITVEHHLYVFQGTVPKKRIA